MSKQGKIIILVLIAVMVGGCSNKMDITMDKKLKIKESSEDLIDESNDGDDDNVARVLNEGTESNSLVINEMERSKVEFMHTSSDPGEENFEEMCREEVWEIFGVEIDLTDILPDFYEETDMRYGFYRYPTSGFAYEHLFAYQNDQGSNLRIVLRKDRLPTMHIKEAVIQDMEVSSVMGHDVIIAHYINFNKQNAYYAQFLHDKVGATVRAEEVALDNFVAILEYLLQ